MVNSCIIVGCTNRQSVHGKLFRVPRIRQREGETTAEKTERRLLLWIKAINRKGFTVNDVKPHHKVCWEHFISGRPAYYENESDPDWVPTLKLGHCGSLTSKRGAASAQRQGRLKGRKKQKLDLDAADSLISPSQANVDDDDTSTSGEEYGVNQGPEARKSVACQTDLTGQEMDTEEEISKKKDQAIIDMTAELAGLKDKFNNRSYSEEMFKDNEENIRYYTGLTSWHVLNCFVVFISPVLTQTGRNTLSKFQEILLVLIKLRLGLSNKLLGDLFGVNKSTVSRIFLRVLNVMYWRCKFMILWPDREDLQMSMPLEFVKYFGRHITVIIDCFEIFIETPSNLKAKVKTYSVYKSNNTIKYLIGITPQGSVCFVSDGYGGRTSDKFIVENSSFLSHLQLGDVVLADRGFDCHESVSFMCAELKIPAFTHGKKQLSAYEVESTRKIAHLRIHVERVIGQIRNKFTILKSEIPVDFIKTSDDDNITTLDQIITVCSVVSNLCSSIVPFS